MVCLTRDGPGDPQLRRRALVELGLVAPAKRHAGDDLIVPQTLAAATPERAVRFRRGGELLVVREGIDTLTAVVGCRALDVGSGCEAALPPYSKGLAPKRLEDAARQEVALNEEGILDGGVDSHEVLG